MAAVHFITILCEPNRVISTHRKPYFSEIHPCTNKIVYGRFEICKVFLSVFKIVVVNVPVFFGTVDSAEYMFLPTVSARARAVSVPPRILGIRGI